MPMVTLTDHCSTNSGLVGIHYNLTLKSDLGTIPVAIKTDSVVGSFDLLRIVFYSPQQEYAGQIDISFSAPPHYYLHQCLSSPDPADLQINFPSERDKILKIARIRDQEENSVRLQVTCNDKEIVDVTLSNETCKARGWSTVWNREIAIIGIQRLLFRNGT